MEKKKIRVRFEDMWFNNIEESLVFSYIWKVLSEKYNLEISDTPDFIISSCFGSKAIQYDCCKIFFAGENIIPDFNLYDYAIGFQWLQYEDRYLRFPLYALCADEFKKAKECKNDIALCTEPGTFLHRKFCNFVVSNAMAVPIRDEVFLRLSDYKKIDSGGRHLNNIGGPVKNKEEFQRQYKFSLTFENSSVNGYTTEKIIQAWAANTVPIYWGNPLVTRDFNEKAFINCNGKTIEEIVEEVKRIDQDDNLYMEMLRQPIAVSGNAALEYSAEKLLSFFQNIFEREAGEQNQRSGFQRSYYGRMLRYSKLENNVGAEFLRNAKRKIRNRKNGKRQ